VIAASTAENTIWTDCVTITTRRLSKRSVNDAGEQAQHRERPEAADGEEANCEAA